ncbi:MAG: response regulator [bacterium]|nr:response regulator [bacterium]
MSPVMVVDSGSLLCGVIVIVLLALHRRCPWDRNTFFLVVLLACAPILRDISNILEWTFAAPILDTLEDYVELLIPMLWIFVLYALLQQRTHGELTVEIEQRVRAENALLDRNAILEEMNEKRQLIIEGTRALAGCTSMKDCAEKALKAFGRATSAEGGSLYVKEGEVLVLLKSLDPGHAPGTLPFPLDPRTVFGHVWEGSAPFLTDDLGSCPDLTPSGWAGYRDGSVLAMTLRDDRGERAGLVALHNRKAPPFSTHDRDVAGILLSVCSETVRAVEAVNALRTGEERFRTMLDFTYDWEYWLDPDGRFIYVSPSCERITGHTREEFMADPHLLVRITHPEDVSIARQHLSPNAKYDHAGGVDFRVVRPDGEVRWINHVCRPVYESDGKFAGQRASNRDVTQERALEGQLRQAQKMEAVGQLAGGVAHDFNNVLQAIGGYITLGQEELPEGHAARSCLAEATRASERAAALVRQLLTLSRREAMEPRCLDLTRVMSDVLNMLRRVIGEHVELVIKQGPQLSAVYADPAQLEQVLINLCVNARDAMPKGGTITIELDEFTFDEAYLKEHPWARLGRYVLLLVSDTGVGIPPEVVSHIFEPFFTTKETGRGTGLGLATVYGIVKQHEGFIHVYSEPGIGTTFRIYFPVEGGGGTDAEATLAQSEPRGGTETILLAEDDELVRGLAVSLLERAGYTVLVARDGDEAVRMFEQEHDRIDLCMLDVVMPKLGGKDVHDHIKSTYPDLPVLFSSGYSFGSIDPQSLPSADSAFIAKPYSPTDLLRRIRLMLDGPEEKSDAARAST